jgi:hypothetical protein
MSLALLPSVCFVICIFYFCVKIEAEWHNLTLHAKAQLVYEPLPLTYTS